METCVSTAHQSNNKSIYGGTFGWTVLTALQKKYEVYSLCPLYFYQLLALTIQQEKPELETEKTRLLQQEEDKKIQLAQLEESLLEVCTHTHTHTLQSSVEGKTSWRRRLQVFLP